MQIATQTGFAYCESMLPKVSRTFALSIKALRGDLYRSVVVAYLWCRILDTIEDAARFPMAAKVAALSAFEDLFPGDSVDLARLDRLVAGLGQLDGEAEELDIVRNSGLVAGAFNLLPAAHRAAIVPALARMARGMAGFLECGATPGLSGLESEADLDRYCYVAAGTVGEMLTELFLHETRDDEARARVLRSLAVSFGLGLQATNITKDLMVDLDRGWCYVPRSMLAREPGAAGLQSLADADRALAAMVPKCVRHLRDAVSYITALPRSARRIRLFCIWPVWLAARTLMLMSDPGFAYHAGVSPKITRREVADVLRRTSVTFWSDGWLRRDFDRMAAVIAANLARRAASPARALQGPVPGERTHGQEVPPARSARAGR